MESLEETFRYFIELSFNGTRFNGWQIQPNAPTVQDLIEGKLAQILGERPLVVGAGRTDSGVHASFYVAHFDTTKRLTDTANIMYRLNKMLGADVSILRIYPVKNEAHARFSADARKYIYYVNFQKDPFAQEIEWLYPYHLDFEAMNQAAAVLFEFSDFTSFSKLHTQVKTNICRIDEAKWLVKGSKAEFHIKADRFLRNMVRAIVGTMIEVGLGRVSVDEFRKIIALKDRSRAGYSVPGKGLFLTDVIYPDGLQMQV